MEKVLKEILKIRRESVSNSGSFKFFLPLSPEMVGFVVDNHKGGACISLAFHISKIFCFCSNYENAILAKQRNEENKIVNTKIVVGNIEDLPFKKNVFSIIYFDEFEKNLIDDRNLIKQKILKLESHLVAKGFLYLSFNKIKTYSFSRIKKICTQNAIIRDSSKAGLNIFKELCFNSRSISIKKKWNFLNTVQLIKDGSSGKNWGVVFQKTQNRNKIEDTNSFIKSIQGYIENNYSLKLKIPSFLTIGSNDSIIIDFGKYIVRLPQTKPAKNKCRNNFEMLKNLSDNPLGIKFPQPITKGNYNGQSFFIESKIAGISLDSNKIKLSDQIKVLQDAYELLTDKRIVQGSINEEKFNFLVTNQIKLITPLLRCENMSLFNDILAILHQKFFELSVPLVICHGDFKFSNFICTFNKNPRLISVIDWEYSLSAGFPMYDLFTLMAWNVEPWSTSREPIVYRFWSIANSSSPPFLYSYLKTFGLSDSILRPLAIIFMITYINEYFYQEIKSKECWYDEIIENCLVPICKKYLIKN